MCRYTSGRKGGWGETEGCPRPFPERVPTELQARVWGFERRTPRMPKTRPAYAPEFRAEAVRLVREHGRTITAVAAELGMSQESLRQWLRRAEQEAKGEALSESEREELRRLRRENRVLAEEREILKKVFHAPFGAPRSMKIGRSSEGQPAL